MKIVSKAKHCIEYLLGTPGGKTIFSVVFPIITGVLSGTFVSEIANKSGLNWSLFYKTKSFYGLLFITILLYFYHRALYAYETKIMSFSDPDFCLAYMRSKCLPEAAEKYKEKIRNGNGGELVQIMTELKKSLE